MVPYFCVAHIVTMMLSGEQNFSRYVTAGIIALCGYFGKVLFSCLSTTISHTATYYTLRDLRENITAKLARVPMGTILDTPSGQYKTTIVDRVEGMESTFAHLIPEMTANVLVPLVIAVYLFLLDWRMALLSLVTLVVGLAVMSAGMKNYPVKWEGAVKAGKQMANAIVEYIGGIEVVKAFSQSAGSYKKYSDAVNYNANYYVDWMHENQKTMSAYNAILPSVLICVLPCGFAFWLSGSLELSTFLSIVIFSLGLIGPIIAAFTFTDDLAVLGTNVEEISQLLNAGNMASLLQMLAASMDTANSIDDTPVMDEKGADITPKSSEIVFNKVDFSYADRKILDQVSFTIPEKTTTAIVGPSGAGKTTMCNLIARFWDVNAGKITIGGTDVRDFKLDSLMKNISMVFQSVYLFADTIENNIKFGCPDATHEQVVEAAKKACCHNFISALPDGYDTVIGEGGGTLSGGEKQRIAIARAMLKDAPIIILDEATSSVDPENEDELQRAIEALTHDKTIIMIAHRLKTVRNADQILVLDNAHIVQRGTHAELIRQKGLYADFVSARQEAIGWKLAQ